jgi:hypothetical protein
MEVSGQLHAPAAVPQGKRLWYPLDRWLDGPQSRSGRAGEEKNSQTLLNTSTSHKNIAQCTDHIRVIQITSQICRLLLQSRIHL